MRGTGGGGQLGLPQGVGRGQARGEPAYMADISVVAASSSTIHWLTTTPEAPAARNAHASPTGSAVSPDGRPDSQALSVTKAPPRSRSRISPALIHLSASRRAENSGLPGR